MSETQWKLVPVKPTEEMLRAGSTGFDLAPFYADMIQASPPPPDPKHVSEMTADEHAAQARIDLLIVAARDALRHLEFEAGFDIGSTSQMNTERRAEALRQALAALEKE